MFLKLKILVAPMDWGLGHATRCLPLIDYLMSKGHEIVLAGAGAAATVLRENFPTLPCLSLPAYNISYPKNRKIFALSMIAQIPRMMHTIRRENAWLQRQQREHQFDLIISDNRYGLYLKRVPSIIMTHQLEIQSGWGKSANALLQKCHYRLLQRFSECWIVDREARGLSGRLAHPEVIPPQSKYIGLLSQLALHVPPSAAEHTGCRNEILLLLSGPEPARTELETLLLRQVEQLDADYHFTMVAGNPSGRRPDLLPKQVDFYPYVAAADLCRLMARAELVICRSGYSSVMDLVYMKKKAVLIPTPGQTEQEYLAAYLSSENVFYAAEQQQFQLERAIRMAGGFRGRDIDSSDPHARMKTAVDGVINKVVSFRDEAADAPAAADSSR